MADPVAREIGRLVGSVLAPCEITLAQICDHIVTPDFDQGTDQAVFGDWADPRQPRTSRPTKHAEENRLRLIVLCMPGGDSIDLAVGDAAGEKCQARATSFLLQVAGRGGEIQCSLRDGKIKRLGEV